MIDAGPNAVPERHESAPPCARCGTALAPGLLSCPSCHALVYADDLKRLAAEAEQAEGSGDPATALARWRDAFTLLPSDAGQRAAVEARIAALSTQQSRSATQPPASLLARMRGKGAIIGGALLVLWKFKAVAILLLTKGKLLLFGLTKGSTLLSMFASFGLYWTLWGWKLAAGFIVSLWLHELGHVAALKRLGITPTAMMFIPGFGAMVTWKSVPLTPAEHARVSLGGPLWGLCAAGLAYAGYLATGWGALAATAQLGGWINLLNLLPVWQLDGAHAFPAFSRAHRWTIAAAMVAAALITWSPWPLALAIGAAIRAYGESPAEGHRRSAITYAVLGLLLAVLAAVDVPAGVRPGR